MDQKPRILAFAGSARSQSLNKKVLPVAALEARRADAKVTQVDSRDFPMPLYDGASKPARASRRTSCGCER